MVTAFSNFSALLAYVFIEKPANDARCVYTNMYNQ